MPVQMSDVEFGGRRKKPTLISRQFMYFAGASSHTRELVKSYAKLLEKGISILQPVLGFDDAKLQMRICRLQSTKYTGMFYGGNDLFEIDPMGRRTFLDPQTVCSTLIHELTHQENPENTDGHFPGSSRPAQDPYESLS